MPAATTQLDYGHRPPLLTRFAHARFQIFLSIAVLSCLGLLTLRLLDRHGISRFAITCHRLDAEMLSSHDQLAFTIQDEDEPIGWTTLFGRVPATAQAVRTLQEDYQDDAGCPERDDLSTYEISLCFHPWTDLGYGWHRPRGLKTLIISRPFGPKDEFKTCGWVVIFPIWWLAAALALPMLIWVAIKARRKISREPLPVA